MTLGFLSKLIGGEYVRASLTEERIHTHNIRLAARRAGWPSEAVNGLSIKVEDGKYHPHIDPTVKPLVDSITYGNSSTQSSHVILAFMRTLGPVA
jgi:hypothetical protein